MSMAPFWPVEVDSLVAHTTELTAEAFGAYMLLMIAQWQNNGRPLPNDDHKLARIGRLSLRRWKTVIRPAVEPFFDIDNDSWSQKRVAKDFKKTAEKIRKNRENGARGGRAKALKKQDRALANARSSPNSTPTIGGSERPGDCLAQDESEGRRIPPPLNREGGNPSSAYGDNPEPSSNGRDGEGLQESSWFKSSPLDENDAAASKFFEGRRPSDKEIAAWNQALQTLRVRSESTDYTYLQPLELVAVDGNTVTLSAPTQLIRGRASELSGRIRDALQDAGLAIATVHIEIPNVSAKG